MTAPGEASTGEQSEVSGEPEPTREEKIESLTNALWRTTDEKLDVISAIIDL